MSAYNKIKTMALCRRSKLELSRFFDMDMQIDFGHEFLNSLFYGTLKSMAERVDSNGFCQTSYGEENGVKCYGHVHYPRDSAEAAYILASCGMTDIARKILSFTIDNIPSGQYYIPHVYRRDGTVHANTVQVDTPGHVGRALLRCVEVAGTDETSRRLFEKLTAIYTGTWKQHFHPEYQLLDAGNYNEQGFDGSNEVLLDLFTNTAMYCGFNSMSSLACFFNNDHAKQMFKDQAEILAHGIENVLYDRSVGFYRTAFSVKTKRLLAENGWLMLYGQRWYPGRESAWRCAYEKLQADTSLDWDGFRLITGEPPQRQFMLLGKVFAQQLAHMAHSGRGSELEAGLDFMISTVRHPENIYPEWWFHHRPADLSGYFKGFLEDYHGLWNAYTEDRNGDYTVDSGNCEQSAVFLQHMLADIIGIQYSNGKLKICPALKKDSSCDNIPIIRQKEQLIKAGYRATVEGNRYRIAVKISSPLPIILELPIEKSRTAEAHVNGARVETTRQSGIDHDKIDISLSDRTSAEIILN